MFVDLEQTLAGNMADSKLKPQDSLDDCPAFRLTGKRPLGSKKGSQPASGSHGGAVTLDAKRKALVARMLQLGWTDVPCGFLCGRNSSSEDPITPKNPDGSIHYCQWGAGKTYRRHSVHK